MQPSSRNTAQHVAPPDSLISPPPPLAAAPFWLQSSSQKTPEHGELHASFSDLQASTALYERRLLLILWLVAAVLPSGS